MEQEERLAGSTSEIGRPAGQQVSVNDVLMNFDQPRKVGEGVAVSHQRTLPVNRGMQTGSASR